MVGRLINQGSISSLVQTSFIRKLFAVFFSLPTHRNGDVSLAPYPAMPLRAVRFLIKCPTCPPISNVRWFTVFHALALSSLPVPLTTARFTYWVTGECFPIEGHNTNIEKKLAYILYDVDGKEDKDTKSDFMACISYSHIAEMNIWCRLLIMFIFYKWHLYILLIL